MQVYRHMDIGTAKPSALQRSRLPHHLVDIAEPSQQFNAGEFVKAAEDLIGEIRARGRVPVVSGGTAFYVRSLLYGLPESPPGSPETREALRERERREGQRALYEELCRRDPQAAARIQPNDRYRTTRALEILEATGRSVFSFHWPSGPRPGYSFLLIGLDRERADLYARIEQRVARMFEDGLVAEVKSLLAMGYDREDPGMRGIGYREFFDMQRGCMSMAGLREAIARDSRRYAKRQLTFFRAMRGVVWMHPDQTGEIRVRVERFLGESIPGSVIPGSAT
jgi:tRNA dimethylallyltransferase